jgi:hypothetical protein
MVVIEDKKTARSGIVQHAQSRPSRSLHIHVDRTMRSKISKNLETPVSLVWRVVQGYARKLRVKQEVVNFGCAKLQSVA